MPHRVSRLSLPTLAVAAALLLPGAASAQIIWDSPILLGPGTPGGFGVFVTNPEPGSEASLLMTWRESSAPGGFGFRGSVGEGYSDDLAVAIGVDYSGTVLDASDEFPLDAIWFVGAGASVGDFGLISIPAGFSFGRTFETDGVLFRPYGAPKVHLDGEIGGGDAGRLRDDDEVELGFTLDLGADIQFVDEFTIRFGASVGDRESLAVGVQFGG